jgi:hypothetical protein
MSADKQFICSIIRDLGDGSSRIDWYRNIEKAEKLIEEDIESYWANDGGPDIYTFPADLNLEECGFRFRDSDE